MSGPASRLTAFSKRALGGAAEVIVGVEDVEFVELPEISDRTANHAGGERVCCGGRLDPLVERGDQLLRSAGPGFGVAGLFGAFAEDFDPVQQLASQPPLVVEQLVFFDVRAELGRHPVPFADEPGAARDALPEDRLGVDFAPDRGVAEQFEHRRAGRRVPEQAQQLACGAPRGGASQRQAAGAVDGNFGALQRGGEPLVGGRSLAMKDRDVVEADAGAGEVEDAARDLLSLGLRVGGGERVGYEIVRGR